MSVKGNKYFENLQNKILASFQEVGHIREIENSMSE